MTQDGKKRPMQVALNLPEGLEKQIRQNAKSGFRTIPQEIVMRLVQHEEASKKKQSSPEGATA